MNFLRPDWTAPNNIKAFFSDRRDGLSEPPYFSFNLASHVGDDPASVARNRALLPVPNEPIWLEQAHTDVCINADLKALDRIGDASVTRNRGIVLAVMVADCLPVMFSSFHGDVVGVSHAGWRGLANEVLASTVTALSSDSLLAWMGPAIGPCHYVVGQDVRARFSSGVGFVQLGRGKFSMNLYAIAEQQLRRMGVQVFGGGICTYCDASKFFSHRRDGVTGRMAGFIWRD